MSKIEVDAITEQSGSTLTTGGGAGKTVVVDATTVTLGRCGGTVALASGASQSGFGRTGTVDWQTSIKTANFTAANGEGYFVNTTSGAVTVTLPASPSVGNIVAIKDYANTSDTNAITIARNGSNIDGTADNPVVANEGGSVTLVYADATKGWLTVDAAQKSDIEFPQFITATGGTITTVCSDFKVHTFTGPGTFTVTCAGNAQGSNTVDYLVIAGGGGGAHGQACFQSGGAGGAGGYRESSGGASGCYSIGLPANSGVAALPVTAADFPVVVGGGGAGAPNSQAPNPGGANGSNSSFRTITSTGGGLSIAFAPSCGFAGGPGGSGGGGSSRNATPVGINPTGPGGNGNTPPVSPSQGNPGGSGTQSSFATNHSSGGGGGAGGTGGDGAATGNGGNGGAAATSSINGTPTARAGGGAGSASCNDGGSATGGGGAGVGGAPGTVNGIAGTANTGGGGSGGTVGPNPGNGAGGGTGGSGIVIIRYKFQ